MLPSKYEDSRNFSFEMKDQFNSKDELFLNEPFENSIENCVKYTSLFIRYKSEVAAYMELLVFDGRCVLNCGEDILMLADDEDAHVHESFSVLEERGLLDRDLFELGFYDEALETNAKININHIAVKEKFRNRGIAKWLLNNLFNIVRLNYNMFPDVAAVKLYPQKISWEYDTPTFENLSQDLAESKAMFKVMKKLFLTCGFKQHEDTEFFVKDFLKDYKK